jgi:hypothetical protein
MTLVDRSTTDPFHETMDIFHGIFKRKIIPLNPIIPRPQYFCKNTPELL